jgi:hypothetical protein
MILMMMCVTEYMILMMMRGDGVHDPHDDEGMTE